MPSRVLAALATLIVALAGSAAAQAVLPAAAAVRGDSALDARVAAYLRPHVEMDHFAGVALVARGDEVPVHRAFGLADRELDVPFTVGTRFRIGSITKDFTAALVLALEAEGALSTDDPIARLLPEFPSGDRIRIRHLLNHTHGIPNWRSLPGADRLAATGVSIGAAVEILARQPLQFEPGAERRYGSSGYLLLARIVELATGQPYEEALRARILEPLGLTDTGSLRGLEIVPRLAEAYEPSGSPPWLRHADPTHPAITVGSASLYSTARDLLAWSTSGPAGRLGWGEARQHGRDLFWTSGLTAGFVARVHRFPAEDLTLVLLSNVFSPAFRPILRDVAGMAFEQEVEPPEAWEPIGLSAAERSAVTGRWVCERGFTEFAIEEADGELHFRVDDARFPFVPRAPDLLHLPTDYGTLRFGDPGPRGFETARYDGGFAAECERG